MKNKTILGTVIAVSIVVLVLLTWGNIAHALSTFVVVQGGTGTTTPSGILSGDNGATNHLNTVKIGSGLSYNFGTNTLTASGGSGSGNVSTSTTETQGFLAYWTSTGATPALLGKVATGTVSNGTGISVTAGQSVIGSGLTITNTGVTSNVAGTGISVSGATGAVTVTNTSPLSSLTTSFPLSFSSPTLSWVGIATSAPLTTSQVLYATGVNTFAGTGTSTLTASSPLTGSFTHIGTTGSLGCQTASGSQAGCLSAADWTTFNNKGSGTVTGVTGVYPVLSSGGAAPAISLAFATSSLIHAGTGISTTTTSDGSITINNTGVISNSCPGGFLTCSGTNPSSFTLGTLGITNGGTGTSTSGIQGQTWIVGPSGIFNATSSIFVATTGFVGIGTTSPQKPLHVEGNTSGGVARIQRDFTSMTANTLIGTYDVVLNEIGGLANQSGPAQTFGVESNGGAEQIQGDIFTVRDGADSSGSIGLRSYNTGNPVVAFQADHLQNVLISPVSGLDTIGTSTGQANTQLTIVSSTSQQLALGDASANPLWSFRDIAGTLNIGTSSNLTGATSTPSAIQISSNTATLFGVATTSPASTLTVNGTVTLHNLTASAGAGSICATADGLISYDSGANCITSTPLAKYNIHPITDEQASEVLYLQPAQYNYYSDGSIHYGFLADAATQRIDSSLVVLAQKDTEVIGKGGKTVIVKKGEPLSFDYERYTALLTAEVQHQQKEIDSITGSVKKSLTDDYQNWALMIMFLWLMVLTFRKRA